MPDSKTADFIQQIDKHTLACLEKGHLPNIPEIKDLSVYMAGFVSRNMATAAIEKTAWATAQSIRGELMNLDWDLLWLIRWSSECFEYAQAKKNLSFASMIISLITDLEFYWKARSVKYWDECYWDNGFRTASPWDIHRVNGINKSLANVVELVESYISVDDPGDKYGLKQNLTDALPAIREFIAYFPTFCDALNQNNYLDLTDKVIVEDLAPTLEVVLPSQTDKSAQQKRAFTPLAKITENKAVADFQGFVIGIVLEPGSPERPDLHGQWMSAEDIERSCDHWSLFSQKVGIQHQEWAEQQGINHPDFVCVRNWIEYGEPIIGGYKVKPGTWLQAYQAVSERGVQMLKNYEINGLSPGGIGTVWAAPKQEEDDE